MLGTFNGTHFRLFSLPFSRNATKLIDAQEQLTHEPHIQEYFLKVKLNNTALQMKKYAWKYVERPIKSLMTVLKGGWGLE